MGKDQRALAIRWHQTEREKAELKREREEIKAKQREILMRHSQKANGKLKSYIIAFSAHIAKSQCGLCTWYAILIFWIYPLKSCADDTLG